METFAPAWSHADFARAPARDRRQTREHADCQLVPSFDLVSRDDVVPRDRFTAGHRHAPDSWRLGSADHLRRHTLEAGTANSVGLLSTGNETWEGGGMYEWKIADVSGAAPAPDGTM